MASKQGKTPTSEQRQQSRFKRLQGISVKLLSQLELEPLLESIASGVVEFLEAGSGGIYRYDAERGELDPTIHIHQPEEALYRVRPGEGMAGRVLQSGKPMKVDNYDEWDGRNPKQPRGIVGAVAQAPVMQGKEILGVIFAERRPGRPPFSEEDMADLQLFASMAAIAIANAELYESARRSADELTNLYTTTLEISKQLEVSKVLQRIISRASKLVSGRYGQFYEFDPDTELLVPAVPDLFPNEMRTVNMKPGEGLSGHVFASRQPLIIDDYDAWEGRAKSTPKGVLGRVIGIPVEHGDQILGVLSLSRPAKEPPFNQDNLRLLSLFANQAGLALANAQQFEELQKLYAQVKEKESLETELRLAYSIQAGLLPKRLPRPKGWSFAAQWSSAKQVSGDFYDVLNVAGGRKGLVIADVAGKGIPAAVFMAFCRTLTRTFAIDGRSPAEALQRVNDLILADSSSGLFVTMFYALLDPHSGSFSYVNAGHPRPLWYHHQQGTVSTLRADGMALGVIYKLQLEQKTVEMQPGDAILLYTDGMSEATRANGDLFGDRRIQTAFRQLAKQEPEEILAGLNDEVTTFRQGEAANDDLTAIVVKRKLAS